MATDQHAVSLGKIDLRISIPSLPILVGGLMIIAGGMIVTFWKPV